jgi:TonB family protein
MKSPHFAQSLLVLVGACLVAAPSSFGWGSKGHKMINRLAAEALPADMPAFLRTPEAISEIEYLGPEPDRWRSRAEPELSAEQAPDHFIDLELADVIGPLPRRRYDFVAALYAYAAAHPAQAADERPEKVGFQPYITSEVWERLKSAMRDYRELSAQKADTKPVEAAILFYAGWLGHYVGDGSMPLHTTIQYNGWVGPNPNGYTTEHHIHSQFESTFVDAEVNPPDVQPLLSPAKAIGDEWDDYLAYLRHTNALVEKVYQLDKAHGFDGAGTPEARAFTAERLAAAASMLRDLYVAAWVKSAEPVPEWHEEHANAMPTTAGAAAQGIPVTGLPVTNAKEAPNSADDAPVRASDPHAVKPPFLQYAPDPAYTQEARNLHIQGVVLVGLIVDAAGTPQEIRVIRPLGHGLDEQAVIAVSKFRFKPAIYHGKPVPVQINIEVNFHLLRDHA